ncbi:MAG: sec-independent protein translocase protein [Candidatus Saccharibacteria bacterium]|nr:sec-independent protein translocase protein [Candidatus Saccharibacteria bacterium]
MDAIAYPMSIATPIPVALANLIKFGILNGMELVDTHCHIQFPDYGQKEGFDASDAITAAQAEAVTRLLCVGTDLPDSRRAIDFVQQRDNCWATIGLHPHEGASYAHDNKALEEFAALVSQPKVVAIGECGLDYYYHHSPKADQEKILRWQLELATTYKLPCVFHVRDAFDDFWKIVDNYPGITGVIHSFTADKKVLLQTLQRGYYVGLNGIMTFTRTEAQLEAAKAVPLDKLLLETDAPFLTPVPFRGKICQPKHVRLTAQFLANLRGETLSELASATTANALSLFNLSNVYE